MSNPSNPSQSYILIMKIRSDLLLKKMFSHVKERKKLQILRENKRIRYEINISIDDYKNFKKIEIIIIPKKNIHDAFINIIEEEKSKYHVYFNDKKEEEENKETKISTMDIEKIKIILDEGFMTFSELFSDCCCKSIQFIKFNRTNIDNMYKMFYNCQAKTINLSNWGIRNVKDMSYMFAECKCLKELYIYNINVENVTNMEYMFYDCNNLKTINLSNLDAKKCFKYGVYVCGMLVINEN